MSRSFASASDHLDNNSPPFTVEPGSIACWVKFSTISVAQTCVTIGASGALNQNRFTIGTNAGDLMVAAEVDTVPGGATLPTGPPDTTGWHLLLGVFASSALRRCYFDGAIAGDTSSKTPTGVNAVGVGCLLDHATRPMLGLLAHVAVWSVALTDADYTALLRVPPNMVQPGALLEYWPLTGNQSPEPSYGSLGNPLTLTGTTFSPDNPIFPGLPMVGESGDYF